MGFVSLKQFRRILKKQKLPPFTEKHEGRLMRILNKLKKLASDGDRMIVDWRMLEARKRKVMKLIKDMKNSGPDEMLSYRVSSELNFILNELNSMADHKFRVIHKVKKMGCQLKSISDEINLDLQKMKEENGDNSEMDTVVDNERKHEFGKKKKRMKIRFDYQENSDDRRDEKADWVDDSTINS